MENQTSANILYHSYKQIFSNAFLLLYWVFKEAKQWHNIFPYGHVTHTVHTTETWKNCPKISKQSIRNSLYFIISLYFNLHLNDFAVKFNLIINKWLPSYLLFRSVFNKDWGEKRVLFSVLIWENVSKKHFT